MATLPIRFAWTTGRTLVFKTEQLGAATFLDWADGQFRATPATATRALTESETGFYTSDITLSSFWANAQYCISIRDTGLSGQIIASFSVWVTGVLERTPVVADSVTAAVQLDMTQALVDGKAATVGGALHGSWSDAFGKSVRDTTAKLIKLFGAFSQTVPLVTYTLDDNNQPTIRTPS